ncbi:MAG: caspase family protein [Leptospiraceae bacterium]|nr:caspase family protein [Leptospiraceae bacterium]
MKKIGDKILFLILLSPILILSQEQSNSPQFLEIEGEIIKLKKESTYLPGENNKGKNEIKSKPEEVNYTSPKSIVKYNLKSKGLKIVELDNSGEPVNQGKRYAIVIGINDYKDIALSDLSKARYDAKAVGKTLSEQGQFDQVFIMTDDIDFNGPDSNLYPTRLNIEEKIDSVLRIANPEDLIVLFFSGHGISDYDENGYLVAVDTVADKAYNSSVKIEDIVQKLKKKGIKNLY